MLELSAGSAVQPAPDRYNVAPSEKSVAKPDVHCRRPPYPSPFSYYNVCLSCRQQITVPAALLFLCLDLFLYLMKYRNATKTPERTCSNVLHEKNHCLESL